MNGARLVARGRRLERLSFCLALFGCSGPRGEAASAAAAVAPHPSPAAPSEPVAAAAETRENAQTAPSSGSVKVDLEPSCGASAEAASASSGGAPSRAWLDNSGVRERGAVLQRELAGYKRWKLGWYPDDALQAVVVVFHTNFTAYDEVRRKLEAVVGPLRVVLRPACYPPEQIAAARETLERADWHPRAKSFRMASHLDPSFSGFVVTIDESAPEVARALEQRLGPLVRVRLGKPHG